MDETPETPEIHGCPVTRAHGQEVIHPTRDQYLGVAGALADEHEVGVGAPGTEHDLCAPLSERALRARGDVL